MIQVPSTLNATLHARLVEDPSFSCASGLLHPMNQPASHEDDAGEGLAYWPC